MLCLALSQDHLRQEIFSLHRSSRRYSSTGLAAAGTAGTAAPENAGGSANARALQYRSEGGIGWTLKSMGLALYASTTRVTQLRAN